LSMRILATW